jgi:hypothetical protein
MRHSLPVVLLLAASPLLAAAATFNVPASQLADPLVLVAYGDMRFTQGFETAASSPNVRQALVARIAQENPAAVFINGDLPWHGVAGDYAVYRSETLAWRDRHLRIFPALGNHEFAGCLAPACLDLWWSAFPQLRGRRWYSIGIGDKVVGIALDSDASLLPGSEQRSWLEAEMSALDPAVRLVLIVMHHPPVADIQTVKLIDHNPRSNEQALAAYLRKAAAQSQAQFVISAGHIHNYERFAQDGVVYLVSGGGGATPYDVDRTAFDLCFPNYHYVRFELRGHTLIGEMIRLEDYTAPKPGRWRIADRFEITLRP